MARKLWRTVGAVKIYRDSEWDEYIVKDTREAGDGYHTDDKQDALDTAAHMNKHYASNPGSSVKAIVTRANDRGVFDEVGSVNRAVVSHLTSESNILRWAEKYANGAAYRVEFFHASKFYGEPYKVVTRGNPVRSNPSRPGHSLKSGAPVTGYLDNLRPGAQLTAFDGKDLPWVLVEHVKTYRDSNGDKSAAVVLAHARRKGVHAAGYVLVDGGSLFRGEVTLDVDPADRRQLADLLSHIWNERDEEDEEEQRLADEYDDNPRASNDGLIRKGQSPDYYASHAESCARRGEYAKAAALYRNAAGASHGINQMERFNEAAERMEAKARGE